MKIAAFSDCHWLYQDIKKFPKADACIFAGDWSGSGWYMDETLDFLKWFSALDYKTKIAIPGNHDRCIEFNQYACVDIFKNNGVTLLVDDGTELDGLKVYGTPWSTEFNNWAYMLPEDKLKYKFKQIPTDTDILITHTPPKGICDPTGYGSEALRKRLNDIHPSVHIFGHNHGGYGFTETINTKFYNVSVCSDADIEHNFTYQLINPITVIDL